MSGKRHATGRRISRSALRRMAGAVAMVAVLAVLTALSRNLPPPSSTSRAASHWSGRCVGVSDGDTLSVMRAGAAVKIRLHGVDCPEQKQAFGSAAKRFTSDMVFGKEVTVQPQDTDRYGRTVAEVLAPDGASLNRALVAAGLAWWYRQYAPNDQRLQALEAEARQKKRGLWAEAKPVPPWEFRKTKRGR